DQPASRADLLAAIGLGNETRNLRRHLDPLLAAGLLARTIPDLPTSSRQRYRITPRGCAQLARAAP
ncbi:MAG: Fic family protein, partial [Angustibacter sp.]